MRGGIALSRSLLDALIDCAGYPEADRGTYIWKPKSMKKLADLGLVKTVPVHRNYSHKNRGKVAYTVTDAGREVLKF